MLLTKKGIGMGSSEKHSKKEKVVRKRTDFSERSVTSGLDIYLRVKLILIAVTPRHRGLRVEWAQTKFP